MEWEVVQCGLVLSTLTGQRFQSARNMCTDLLGDRLCCALYSVQAVSYM